jgi:hypothetical protein
MRRIAGILIGLLCLSAVSFAQASVPVDTALTAAIADVNAKLGTAYTYNGGQLNYTFYEERVTGDNLGCPNVAATNQNAYVVMTTRFDFNFDDAFEWEHRFAYEADGSLKMIACAQPDLSQPQPTQAPTATATVAPEDPQATPEGTPVNEAPIFGRDGPRIFPAQVCGELPTRLVNGSIGRVIPGGAQNNLRQTGDLTALKIGELAPGETFTVMDGPFCNGDIAWYLVGDGTTPAGWTAEGVDGDYFLEPQVTDAQLIRPENADQLAPYGGQFGPGFVGMSANTPGQLMVNIDTGVQTLEVMAGFSPLATVQWDVVRESMTPAKWAFADNTGRVWTVGEDNEITAQGLDGEQFNAVGMATTDGDGIMPVAIDGESNFVAITTPNGVELHQIGRNGALNELLMTLPVSGNVLDVAFSSDGMNLFVLTPNELTVYRFVLGEGWTGDAHQTVALDLRLGTLAVAEGGSRVAVAGTTNDGVAAVRVIDNLNSDEGQVMRTILEYNATGDIALLSPSFNADGSLVAVFSTDNSVLLLHPETGATASLETGTEEGVMGSVAFSRDGLILWVYNGSHVEGYAVAAPSAQ